MRLFEATGLGCTLITDHKSDLHEYFEIDREVYDFENTEDLSNKINYLRDNISVAINMGIKIQMKCLSKYNIDIQLDILKEYIKSEYTN